MTDLRLDQQSGLFSEGADGWIVTPGEPETSELWRRITSDDPDTQMPPPSANKSLSDAQKLAISNWVKEGAPWAQHWAFINPTDAAIPDVSEKAWCQNPIDNFILHALEDSALTPSPRAPTATLVRRLFLDLTGKIPSLEESTYWIDRLSSRHGLATVENSFDHDAYEQLVEHLLASPAYGERWARNWLDLARYADSNGYEKDRERSIWPYRDWVINALNDDMPFDKFTIEQLAGDLLPNASESQQVATGFHRNTMLNEEGGIDPLEYRFHSMTDRVATTGTTWLGLTMGCCQCHTHKFDPITHREYYQFMAFLNNADEPALSLSDGEKDTTWQRQLEKANQLLFELPERWPTDGTTRSFNEAFDAWLDDERKSAVAWQPLLPNEMRTNSVFLHDEGQGVIFASGDITKRDDYYLEFAATAEPIHALRLEVFPDPRLPANGPGMTYFEGPTGDFYLTEVKFEDEKGTLFPCGSASSSYAKGEGSNQPLNAKAAIDGDIQSGWSVQDRTGEKHEAVFQFERPIPAGTSIKISMSFGRHYPSSLGKFRWSAAQSTSKSVVAKPHSDEVRARLLMSSDQFSADDLRILKSSFAMIAPELKAQADEIRALQQRPKYTETLVFRERPSNETRPTHLHHRGEYLQPKEPVDPKTPAVLHPFVGDDQQDLPNNRLGFSEWLVSQRNPLTARVAVNRQWAAIFGTGIVKTKDDFGLQGESPSHPELLDWLAYQFMTTDKWSLKSFHRRLVLSATYQQSSVTKTESSNLDPDNRLLSYSPRYRLDAEMIRDSLLVASGIETHQIGGKPVYPPQPNNVTTVAYGSPKWPESQGEDRYRRSLYTFAKRTAPFAMFAVFDAPSGEACVATRDRSNSPLQALTVLNDAMVVELARIAGERVSASSVTTVEAKASRLFQTTFVREPTKQELDSLVEFYHKQVGAFSKDLTAARDFLDKPDTVDLKDGSTAAKMASDAAWSALVRALYGLDEFLTRE